MLKIGTALRHYSPTFGYASSTVLLFPIVGCYGKIFTRVAAHIGFSALYSGAYNSIIIEHWNNQRVDDATRSLLDGILPSDVYSATKMISFYVDSHKMGDALELFHRTPVKDVAIWNLMIKSCVNGDNLEMGLKLFDEMPERNVISWTIVMNAMLKCGKIVDAQRLFHEMPERDVAAWNSMIHGYFQNGMVKEAVRLFDVMPNRNVISWTTMIGGLDQHGLSDEAFSIYKNMMDSGVHPTPSTLANGLIACSRMGYLRVGRQIHCQTVKMGYVFNPYISSVLITFYANCKQMKDFVKSFNEKLPFNVVVWTSILTGYGVNGEHETALKVFGDMLRSGVVPNQSSFTSALNSSNEIEAVDCGKSIHGTAIKVGLHSDCYVGNSLVVLYTKCGNIVDGVVAFNDILHKNIVSWNAIIIGCAQHCYGAWAVAFFTQMAKTGIRPDEITFTGLLHACSHTGMLLKGRQFFKCLSEHTTMKLKVEHYACMVDALCRDGRLDEAGDLVKSMPMEPNLPVWLALLSGCATQSNFELAERVAEQIFRLDPSCSAAYVILSNMYASSGRWVDAARMRTNMKYAKQPACSWFTHKTHLSLGRMIDHGLNSVSRINFLRSYNLVRV